MNVPLGVKKRFLCSWGNRVVIIERGNITISYLTSLAVFELFLGKSDPDYNVAPEYLPVRVVCANDEMFFLDIVNLPARDRGSSYSIEIDRNKANVVLYRNGSITGVHFSPVEVFNLFTGETITHPDDLDIPSMTERRYIRLRREHWSPAVIEVKAPKIAYQAKLVEDQPKSEYVWVDSPAEEIPAEELPICVICGNYIKDVKEQETLKWTNNKGDEISWNDREGLLTVRMNGSTELVNAKSFDEAVDFLFKARRCHVKKSRGKKAG